MYPAPFEYRSASTVAEAIELIRAGDGDAKILAGGHSLIPAMKLRLAQPAVLVDIAGIPGLRGVRRNGDVIEIGAMTTHRDLEVDPVIAAGAPILGEVAGIIGDVQVRNRGTIGGAVAHADPAADYPASILALDATMVAQGPNGTRRIAAGDFFVDLLTTALEPDELLVSIEVPALAKGTGASYQKAANQASGYAIVGVAAVVAVSGGKITSAKIGITGAGPTAIRATAAEATLAGVAAGDAAAVRAAVASAADGIDYLEDIHADAAYRARLVRGLAERAVLSAAASA